MNIEEKSVFIDKVLGFYFETPFLEAANLFPAPESQVDSWFMFATVFNSVYNKTDIKETEKEVLQCFIEDAVAEYEASILMGEEIDMEEELGTGYEEYDIPVDFAKKYQALIWQTILIVYGS